jgi:hypothetical protein
MWQPTFLLVRRNSENLEQQILPDPLLGVDGRQSGSRRGPVRSEQSQLSRVRSRHLAGPSLARNSPIRAKSARHNFAARGAGSVTLNHSTVRSEFLKAFLEQYPFEQKIGYQAAEARIFDL